MIILKLQKCCCAALALLISGLGAATANADFVEDFTVNQNVAFEFGAYAQGVTYDFTSEGIDIDIPSSGDTFGAVGIAASAVVDLSGVTAIEITARLDAGNESPLILAVREDDGFGGDGEFFAFSVDASEFTLGEFVTISVDPTSAFFNGDATDGVLNGILNNSSIQTPFGGTGAQNFTVQSVSYIGAVVVPEPTTAAVLLAACPFIALRRRRR